MTIRYTRTTAFLTSAVLLSTVTFASSSAVAAPATSEQAGAASSNQGACIDKKLLDHGHVDMKVTRTAEGFDTTLIDDTFIVEKKKTERPINENAFIVRDNAKIQRPASLMDPEYDVMGKDGSTYLLPQSQNQQVIWPGYNTQTLNYKEFKNGTVRLNIKPISIPNGASYGLLLDQTFKKPAVLVDSTKNDYTIDTTFASHTHTNWVFSKSGIYNLEVSYEAETLDGATIKSKPQSLVIAVGDDAVTECTTPPASSSSSPVPSPTATTASTTTTSNTSQPTASREPETQPVTTSKATPSTTASEPGSQTSKQPAPEPKPETKPVPQPAGQPTKTSQGSSNVSLWYALIPLGLAGLIAALVAFLSNSHVEIPALVSQFIGQ